LIKAIKGLSIVVALGGSESEYKAQAEGLSDEKTTLEAKVTKLEVDGIPFS